VDVFTAAFRALDLVLFVFCKGEDDFKWFLAIFAVEFVARHGAPRMEKLIKEIVGVDGVLFNPHGLNQYF
jgi:hypothetical protein